jgi:hypothetical protein
MQFQYIVFTGEINQVLIKEKKSYGQKQNKTTINSYTNEE